MSRTSMQRAERCLCIYLYSLLARACVKNRSDFSGTWRAYCRRRRQTRMRNRFGATTARRAGPSSGSVAYNHDQCVSRRAQRRITTTVRLPQQHIRYINLNSEHDEDVRSPMALGRIPSDPDLRVGHSDVGIPQSRRKGNFWKLNRFIDIRFRNRPLYLIIIYLYIQYYML